MLKRFTVTTALCLAISLAIYTAVFAAHIINFPQQVLLTENTEHRLSFGTPFTLKAIIKPDTVDALMVNHTPVLNPVTVNLQNPLWIEASNSGTATMMLSAFGLPLREVTLDVLPSLEVLPGGTTVGVRINTEGVMVLGTGTVTDTNGVVHNPSKNQLRSGDLILTANGKDLLSKEDLVNVIAESGDTLHLRIKRDNETIETTIMPVKGEKGNMIGSWVRDSTQGIGTITYFNPKTGAFGALGHGIMDVDTRKLMSVKCGSITAAHITSVKKGAKGVPGELVGDIKEGQKLGQIKTNSPFGIFGTMDEPLPSYKTPMRIAKQDQIEEGAATIRTNIAGGTVREFDIYIDGVNRFSSDDTKGMVIRITDLELLKLTGGIVQGMSGSPIIQNGRLVGAVTHVFVQDPTKGYGIFIENMIRQEEFM